jgi:methylenetetrahydrofolate reductase (NADPH)
MTKIHDLIEVEPRTFSFEFFPARTAEAVEALIDTAKRLRNLSPSFVSVTYGAGGSTRRHTIDLTARLHDELGLISMAHLTCVGHSQEELREVIEELHGRGIENLMLLRGDPPAGETAFHPTPNGFSNAWQLVELARSMGNFSIGVAGYPEGHQECNDLAIDLEHLRRKVDAGADFIVTQMFFNNRDYFDFVERARKAGISLRIIPGIMPALSWAQINRMSTMCGASIPAGLARNLEAAAEDTTLSARIGWEHAMRQCEDLLEQGAPGVHFYTLNKSRAAEEIFAHLRQTVAAPLLPGIETA